VETGTAHSLARVLPPSPQSIVLHLDLATVTRLRVSHAGERTIEAGCVRGWAVGPEPIAGIDLFLGSDRVATARIGESRPDVAAQFPGSVHAASSGFEALLTGGRLPPGDAEIRLTMRTESGLSLSVVHPLEIIPPLRASHDATSIRMAVDRCSVDGDRRVQLSGWALARGRVAAVQVFAGSEHLATVLPDHERADVAGLFPGYVEGGQCGFALTRQLPRGAPAETTIRVEVVSRDGATRSMLVPLVSERNDTSQREIAPRLQGLAFSAPLQLHCDRISLTRDGVLSVEGWALAAPRITAISIALDGEELGSARLGLSRPDVARAFPAMRDGGEAGFAFAAAVPAPTTGEHELRVVVTLEDGTRRSFAEAVDPAAPGDPVVEQGTGDVLMAVDGMEIADGQARHLYPACPVDPSRTRQPGGAPGRL
jgi:hypothetical protein